MADVKDPPLYVPEVGVAVGWIGFRHAWLAGERRGQWERSRVAHGRFLGLGFVLGAFSAIPSSASK